MTSKKVQGFFLLFTLSFYVFSPFFYQGISITEQASTLPHNLISQLTGKNALSNSTAFDVNGTDLGIIIKHHGEYRYIFGDTFGFGDQKINNWRSNTMAFSFDNNPNDGIEIDGWILEPPTGYAKELISSLKINYKEKTCIPTAALSMDNKIYIYYMSVNHWGGGGQWFCNNASIAVSLDDGQTFAKMNNISWPGDSKFIQFGLVQNSQLLSTEDYLYFLATPSGRFQACYLCRVPPFQILNQEAYEYYVDSSISGDPIWGSDYTAALEVFPSPVGELSIMWNNFLQKWTVFYMDNVQFAIVLRTADHLWGPWSAPHKITTAAQYPTLYGSYVHPDFVENNGETVYFIMSIYSVYNTFVISVDLRSLTATNTLSPTSSTGYQFFNTSFLLGSVLLIWVLIIIRKKVKVKHLEKYFS